MKHKALAIGLAATILHVGGALADYRVAPGASWEERQRYESDHVASGRYHPSNAQARAPGAGVKQLRPFSPEERRWFNQSRGYDQANCNRPTNFPCD